MIDPKTAYEILSSFPGVTVKDHFGSDAFVANKRNFATLGKVSVNARYTPAQQRDFLAADGEAFTEIDNGWGRQGWTRINLEYIDRATFEQAARTAYETSAVKYESLGRKKSPQKKAAKKKPAAKNKTGPKKSAPKAKKKRAR